MTLNPHVVTHYMETYSSILILTREHIGDLVCTTPAIRSLRRHFPNAYIAVEVGERAACVLENSPHVDEILLRRDHQGISGKAEFVRLLRRRRFDLAVILDDCADMALYCRLAGIPRRVGLDRGKRFQRLLTDRVSFDPSAHEMIDNFRAVAARLGADVSDPRPEVFPSTVDIAAVERLLAETPLDPNRPIVALNPGASAPSNRWLPERFAAVGDALAERAGAQILVLGGPGDGPLAQQVAAASLRSPVVLTGRMKVLELAELLRRCDLMVTGDTGPMHLACAVGTRVLALFGPAVPSESGPCYVPGNLVIRKVAGCPNCTKYRCRDHGRCMRAISVEEVTDAALAMCGAERAATDPV